VQSRQLLLRWRIEQSNLGTFILATQNDAIVAILFGEAPQALLNDLQNRFPSHTLHEDAVTLADLAQQVQVLLAGPCNEHKLPLAPQCTVFQRRVWTALCAIPLGRTVSYSEVADMIDSPGAARAIARACAANPVAVAIPCHRVVRSDGALSGYRWGIERKRALLELEGAL
jgi:AraC family transcriptional regulator of adaptative response/methylated-DNA-[protein]-cysteine methyltransferase